MSHSIFPTERDVVEAFGCEIVTNEDETTQFSCKFVAGSEEMVVTFDWARSDFSVQVRREGYLITDLFLDRVEAIDLGKEEKNILVTAVNLRGRINLPPNGYIRVARLSGIVDFPKSLQKTTNL